MVGFMFMLITVSVSALAYILTYQNSTPPMWISKANAMLQDYEPLKDEQQNDPNVTLSFLNMYLVESGNQQLIYCGNGDELSKLLGDLLNNQTQTKGSVDQEFLDKILSNDKVLILTYRISILAMINPQAEYYQGYFILEDNLNKSFEGAIIARGIQTGHLVWLGTGVI